MTSPVLTNSETQFYSWKDYRCAYDVLTTPGSETVTPIVSIHPIGVGLCRRFWDRFNEVWRGQGYSQALYHLDLLGNGESDLPCIPYTPKDWAEQLADFIQSTVQQPVILLVQGGGFPVAIELTKAYPDLVKALVLSGPPSWKVMTQAGQPEQQKRRWDLFFNTILGEWFYRYARTEFFLKRFSIKELFAKQEQVDREWLMMLREPSRDLATRYAVFAFLAGFWRRDYRADLEAWTKPTFAIFGEGASGISKRGKYDPAELRLKNYTENIPYTEGVIIGGRNVLPYESTVEFVAVMASFLEQQGLLK